jgi:hypothetical protein
MSKVKKAQKAAKRKAEKNRARSAAKAQYAAWRDAGLNSKSKRARQNQASSRLVRMARQRVRTKNMVTFSYWQTTWSLVGAKSQRRAPKFFAAIRRGEIPATQRVVLCSQRQHKNQMSFKQFQKLMKRS